MPATKKTDERYLIVSCVFSAVIFAITAMVIGELMKKVEPKILPVDNHQVELDFWREIIEAHPDYFDAYVEIAKLEEKNDNVLGAMSAWGAAKQINPNSVIFK